MNLTKQKYSNNKIKMARDMYMSGINPIDIAAELDMPINDIGYMIYGSDKSGHEPDCWYQQRENLPSDSFSSYVKSKRHVLSYAENQLFQKVKASISNLCDENSPDFDLSELQTAMNIFKDLDKINRLENDRPTDIVEEIHTTTLRDIKNGQSSPITVEGEVISKDSNNERREQAPRISLPFSGGEAEEESEGQEEGI